MLSGIQILTNPFFPPKNNKQVEHERLIQKLESGHVMYLQFGTDNLVSVKSRSGHQISLSGCFIIGKTNL